MAETDILPEVPAEEQIRLLDSLEMYVADAPKGRVLLMPFVSSSQDKIESVEWQIRVHPEGVSGYLPLSEESLDMIDAPKRWLEQGLEARELVREEVPDELERMSEFPEAEAVEAEVKEA